jgi:replicative DNA helicase
MIDPQDQMMLEMCVLGSMLRSKAKTLEVINGLRANMFQFPQHRALFRRIEWITGGDGLEFDDVLLADKPHEEIFENEEQTKGVSIAYIRQLRNDYGVTGQNVEMWADELASSAKLRRIAEITQMENFGREDLGQRLEHIGAILNVQTVKVPPIENYDDYSEPEDIGGVPSKFGLVDNNTETCGLPNGQLTVVAAYAKGGKTACMVQMADAISLQQIPVLYATFADLNKHGIAKRRLKNYCGWSKMPNKAEFQADYNAALRRLRGNGYFQVFDATRGGVTVEALCARVSLMKVKPVLFVDYAQELTTVQRVKSDYERHEVVSRVLTRFAAEHDLPTVVGSQITEGKDGGRDMTKGSRVWEERAGLVLKIQILNDQQREKIGKAKPPLNVDGITCASLAFNRFGPPRDAHWVFNSRYVKFEELTTG